LFSENEKQHIFYFSGIDSLESLSCIPNLLIPIDIKFAATNGKDYLFPDSFEGKTLNEFTTFINTNSQLSFFSIDLLFDNQLQLSTHDDSEVTFTFPYSYDYQYIISQLLNKHHYNSQNVIKQLIENQNNYLIFKHPDIIESKYSDFEEYLKLDYRKS